MTPRYTIHTNGKATKRRYVKRGAGRKALERSDRRVLVYDKAAITKAVKAGEVASMADRFAAKVANKKEAASVAVFDMARTLEDSYERPGGLMLCADGTMLECIYGAGRLYRVHMIDRDTGATGKVVAQADREDIWRALARIVLKHDGIAATVLEDAACDDIHKLRSQSAPQEDVVELEQF